MVFVGIDPGKKGAIATIGDDVLSIQSVPILTASIEHGKKRGRDEYDLAGIVAVFSQERYGNLSRELFVTVEKSQPIPPTIKAGMFANYQRGVARGWEWLLAALEIPYQLVAPRTWQAVMLLGTPGTDTKQRALIAARRLFPLVSLHRTATARKDDDGFADSLLLAEFGRRTMNGGGK